MNERTHASGGFIKLKRSPETLELRHAQPAESTADRIARMEREGKL